MPMWWGKSSSKDEKKKKNKESSVESPHLISPTERKGIIRSVLSRRPRNKASEKRSLSRAVSRSPSPTSHVIRCQSFADRLNVQTFPLPHPAPQPPVNRKTSEASVPMLEKRGKPPLVLPIPTRNKVSVRSNTTDTDGDLATTSISSNCSIDSNDPADSRLHSPVMNGTENVSKFASSITSLLQLDSLTHIPQKKSRDTLKPNSCSPTNQFPSTSPKNKILSLHQSKLPNSQPVPLGSAPESSMSSPCRSPIRNLGSEKIPSPNFIAGKPHSDINALGGHCSSPGQTSGHNSVGGDMTGQFLWQQNRCNSERSPIPSPKKTSPGPCSRIQSGNVTPVHPRAGGTPEESPTGRSDETRKQSHPLPLPPIRVSSPSMFSASNLTCNSSTISQSPGRIDNPISKWKKGKLIGRGTCGHVYVGFNSQSGQMCAMKEVTLFSDDAKSKESAKQLGQEIALLSSLKHQNIVQYYGCDERDDKLYIYLEYVSGGSIHKLLQEYGPFGEPAIRNYTRQILLGLGYLHATSTVHRDIKGANILVDPSGCVKLADFGMAKHITGHSCPLSFKGSPYWMAPEVIKNTNGCNLAVDIWSLGCTVLEMSTSKPPWGQYEGIAAMFKIGNSKELPFIPNSLSDEGKDFIMRCLQREPSNRPTAIELLEHSFVKNTALIERSIINSNPIQRQPTGGLIGINTKGTRHARNLTSLDSEGLASQKLKAVQSITQSSGNHLKKMSCSISPNGLRSRSPQQINERLSPSSTSSPMATSGSSTPLSCGNDFLPHNQQYLVSYAHDGYRNLSRSPRNLYMSGSPYPNLNHDHFRRAGTQPGSPVSRDLFTSESEMFTTSYEKFVAGDYRTRYDGQSGLANQVSQPLERAFDF